MRTKICAGLSRIARPGRRPLMVPCDRQVTDWVDGTPYCHTHAQEARWACRLVAEIEAA